MREGLNDYLETQCLTPPGYVRFWIHDYVISRVSVAIASQISAGWRRRAAPCLWQSLGGSGGPKPGALRQRVRLGDSLQRNVRTTPTQESDSELLAATWATLEPARLPTLGVARLLVGRRHHPRSPSVTTSPTGPGTAPVHKGP